MGRARGAGPVEVAGVRISHPDRRVDAASGATKLDLARYFEVVAPTMVPHLEGRPLTLVHCPAGLGGACHYMKHSKVWAPAAVRRVRIQERTKLGEYLVVDDARALLSVAQMDVVELHTWNSRTAALEEPDRLVLDLDPGPLVPWANVVRAARELRAALRALELASFVKTTGGGGLHVVVPLLPERRWEDALAFARGLALALEHHDPARYTTRLILLDYLRNNRTNTSVAAFSPRARPGLPVSVPAAWDELEPRRPPAHDLRSVPRRLARLGADPWAGYARVRQRLTPELLAAVAGRASRAPAAPAAAPRRRV